MGLLEDLNNQQNFDEPIRTKCKMCEILKELTPNERKALEERLNDPKTGHTALADVLMKNGYNISRSAVSRHRENKGLHGIKR